MFQTILNSYDVFSDLSYDFKTDTRRFEYGSVDYADFRGQKQIVRIHSTNPYAYLTGPYDDYFMKTDKRG